MKNVSGDYIAQEEATKRKPVEFYHIWKNDGGDDRYYTSGDVMMNFEGHDYLPATLKRSLVRYDAQLEVTKCTIQAGFVEDPLLEYIAINPVEIYWTKIMKLHHDQIPLEADVIFLGQIKSVAFKGVQADVECVGFEHFLRMPIPTERYQITCNWQVFDSKCKINRLDYKITTTVTLDTTKTVLTAAVFGSKPAGYFIGGLIEFPFKNEKRAIADHSGSTITMAYRMIHLDNGGAVDVYPGCDGRAETCKNKFNNIVNFLGFPYIPIENPAMRT